MNESTNENLKGVGEALSFKPYRKNHSKWKLFYQGFFGPYFRSLVDNKMIKRSRYYKEYPSFPSISQVKDQHFE